MISPFQQTLRPSGLVRPRRWRGSVMLLCVWLLLAGNISADEVNPDETLVADPATIQQWIDDLGNDQFAKREYASEQLFRLGHLVLPKLHTALRSSTDPEQRERLRQITSVLADEYLDLRIRSFLEGDLEQLENWDRMEKWFGDSPKIRELFVDLYREFPIMIRSLDGEATELAAGLLSVNEQISRRGPPTFRVSPRTDLVALLLPLMQPKCNRDTRYDVLVIASLRGVRGDELREDPAFGQPLRKMVSRWMKASNFGVREAALVLALEWDLEIAFPLAIETLDLRPDPDLLCRCMQVLAKQGMKSDAERLLPYLDRQEEILRPLYARNRGDELQVGDVAAAAIGRLCDANLMELGFENEAEDPDLAISYSDLIIPSTKQPGEPDEPLEPVLSDAEKAWMKQLGLPLENLRGLDEDARKQQIQLIREVFREKSRRDAWRAIIRGRARDLLEPDEKESGPENKSE